ncbi:thiolase family protein [Geodermatophilus sabuli]|uniref:Acetyl-CoA acetyltransferase n=1 Tax=Geodermatophilus sabuli TaxID=1564158 RepID=A0A285E8U1_9ACTN|nr:thiolase family protein [Geodermatophilus sabuli]MBB3082506.1 acetyl-CoA acetyltransferase [Geodermatophilus sabuli]SNX94624.1 Acetyl-CoA acetyltransferase [Geodermatophilus sabuli]
MTELGKVYGKTSSQFAAEATRLAVADAGLLLSDVDGLLISAGVANDVGLELQVDLELRDLKLLTQMQAFGSTAGAMVQFASMAVEAGMAEVVVCVFGDAPLKEGAGAGDAYGAGHRAHSGWTGLQRSTGVVTPNVLYSLAARRHMLRYGTTSEQLGAIAVAQRDWAALNPLAQMRTPITIADHQQSRIISDPFHLFDCCLVSNGGVAVVVSTAERARDLQQPAVDVLGWAQSHPGARSRRDDNFGLVTGAARSGPAAMSMAGVTVDDIDLVEIYDCYTYTALVTLEDYGFCAKGAGGEFVSTPGNIGPAGKLKMNTGGGQLSSYYMWGMTPLSEAVLQARGQAGARQQDRHELVLVSGNGGILDHHSTLILGS